MSETEGAFTIAGVEGQIVAPSDTSIRMLVQTEHGPWGWRTAAAFALCWSGEWPWGDRPTLAAFSYDLGAMGRATGAQLLEHGVYLDDYRDAATLAFLACREGVMRPSEVAAKTDFIEPPSSDDGATTS